MDTEITCCLKRHLNSSSRKTKWNLSTLVFSELQQQTCAQRLGLEDAHHGSVESRREQVRLQEDVVITVKALRETQIRIMHEMGEMKRAQCRHLQAGRRP